MGRCNVFSSDKRPHIGISSAMCFTKPSELPLVMWNSPRWKHECSDCTLPLLPLLSNAQIRFQLYMR